jgi:hypothetical protein
MIRIVKIGTLAGLFGLCLGLGTASGQLPPLPVEAPLLPTPAVDETHSFDPPPTIPSHQPESLPQMESQVAPLNVASPGVPGYYGDTVVPGFDAGPKAWQPGGYEARSGRPYYYTVPGRNKPLYSVHQYSPTRWAIDHSAYQYHFGPGYYRHAEGGDYRFPYYTYRAPWYFPGHPIYNRDTNRPW